MRSSPGNGCSICARLAWLSSTAHRTEIQRTWGCRTWWRRAWTLHLQITCKQDLFCLGYSELSPWPDKNLLKLWGKSTAMANWEWLTPCSNPPSSKRGTQQHAIPIAGPNFGVQVSLKNTRRSHNLKSRGWSTRSVNRVSWTAKPMDFLCQLTKLRATSEPRNYVAFRAVSFFRTHLCLFWRLSNRCIPWKGHSDLS